MAMLKVTGCDVNVDRAILTIETDNGMRMQVLHRGMLEQYMGAYNLPAGAALSMLLYDAAVEEVTAPSIGEPDFHKTARDLARRATAGIEWAVDRDQALADITLADDTAEQVRANWESIVADPHTTDDIRYEEARAQHAERAAAVVAGHQRRREELIAEEFVSAMKEKNIGKASASGAIPMEFANGKLRRKE